MEKKYPGFYRLTDDLTPIELQIEKKRIRQNLISEVSRSIWGKDPNWKKVEDSFELLRHHFRSVIIRLKIDELVKRNWLKRIDTLQLAIPGAFPEISNNECSTTQINAYYYEYHNIITVCAGDFNSEDIFQTLAHEMAHALDLDRSLYLYQISSAFGKRLSLLRDSVCKPQVFKCDDWIEFRSEFASLLSSLEGFQVELPEFQRCLKRKKTDKGINDEIAARLAKKIVRDQLASLAESNIFLRVTKSKIPFPNGKMTNNPNYLNPCGYYLWSKGEEPIDDELSLLLFFTADYQCRQGAPTERLKASIQSSQELMTEVVKKVLKMEGEFSSRSLLESEGFAASPTERFADVVGSYALADFLKTAPSLARRRNMFLASSSWQCSKPSLANQFPEESAIQDAYTYDPHSDRHFRMKEFFTDPVRQSVKCEKDFQFDACELSFVD